MELNEVRRDVAALVRDARAEVERGSYITLLIGIAVLCVTVLFACIDGITWWIAGVLQHVVIGLVQVFVLVETNEYDAKSGHGALELARLCNPLMLLEVLLRALHGATMLLLGSWVYVLICVVPLFAFDITFRTVRRIDRAELWKEVEALRRETLIRFIASCFIFFVLVGLLIAHVVRIVLTDEKVRTVSWNAVSSAFAGGGGGIIPA